ncbi:hypothetical protein [Paenibacillus agilis]|uniref:Uncharacterized protein n=1 Tax=Paenibacillus agilis TaxID=3020863 RepID=A0A559IES1_9BACL|nr:hypothetical protein [Paenibacillus agilis]TVX85963.1 hypothetical protein FPZ44_23710 [Paenibacillus agilis]
MSEINQGSIVTVVDKGFTYSNYTELFNHARKLIKVDILHAYNQTPTEGETYRVLTVVHHLDSMTPTPIALIHNDNLYAYLVEVDGLRLK